MSIGYDSAKVPAITSVDDLAKPEFRGKVALNGDPTQAGAAFSGVLMAALAKGGSADDIAPGVDFFAALKQAGNFLPVDPTPATIGSGQTPVVIDWNYLNAAVNAKLPTWRVFVPDNAAVAGYYYQAINADAPHPAAARLWQEFLYGDEGQNLYAAGGVRPVRADAMLRAGTMNPAVVAKIPVIDGPVTVPSPAQTSAAATYLQDNWAKAVG
jgi:putative spermidine/putrescine transport system substrate-binding protein